MQYINLGSTDLVVSRVCMGCMGFGDAARGQHSWTLDENASRTIIKQGLEAGITFFDTAVGYQSGTSERFLGRALRDFANRDEVVVATKFLPRSDADIEAGVDGRQHVTRMLDLSLTNLGFDHVDLYIYHMWDYRTPLREIMEGLSDAVRAGKVRHVGISNCFAWQLAKANALADAEGFPRFVSVQGHYNLLFREEEREMLPYCREEDIALTPYSPLASGRLARRPDASPTRRLAEDDYAQLKYGSTEAQDRLIIERVAEVAKVHGISMSEVALGWLMQRTTTPVIGMTKLSHVDEAIRAADRQLTNEETAYLEEPYVAHALVGVMAQNTSDAANKPHVWGIGNQSTAHDTTQQ